MPTPFLHVNYVGEGIKACSRTEDPRSAPSRTSSSGRWGAASKPTTMPSVRRTCTSLRSPPNHAAPTTCSLNVHATDTIAVKAPVLLTPEEIDATGKLKPTYSAPGK